MTEPSAEPTRRYSQEEIAYILEQAGSAQELLSENSSSAVLVERGEGLTLAQLLEIGADVGIAPAFITRAARAVERGELVPTAQRTWLGMPIGVSRTIDFGRAVSDAEWERIVVRLRETFEARGRLQQEGTFREWTNGNLQALLEPTASGHRLRLSTRKGDVTSRVWLSGMAMAVSSVAWASLLVRGGSADTGSLVALTAMGLAGAASLLAMRVQLPRWARTRASQMERLAAAALDEDPAVSNPRALPRPSASP
jgi:hypothetical protein